MFISWVKEDEELPQAHYAQSNGLVAAGLDLSPQRLLEAYSKGLFPWFSDGDPVLWWSPNPRMVLYCKDLYISHSLKKRIRQFDKQSIQPRQGLVVTLNTCFDQVMQACASRNDSRVGVGAAKLTKDINIHTNQQGRNGTWITPEIKTVYSAWHQLNYVHSVETWINGSLVGGLYGVSIGKCFYGESMFSHVSDTSKIALAYLVAYLSAQGVEWIDCQQETPHLASMGAKPIDRLKFLHMLAQNINKKQPTWGSGRLRANGQLESNYEQTWRKHI